jgi:hypothetical protein
MPEIGIESVLLWPACDMQPIRLFRPIRDLRAARKRIGIRGRRQRSALPIRSAFALRTLNEMVTRILQGGKTMLPSMTRVAFVTVILAFAAPGSAVFLDFETRADGTPYTGLGDSFPFDEYQSFGVLLEDSDPGTGYTLVNLTNPLNVGTDISGYYVNIGAFLLQITLLDADFDPGVIDISFDFATPDGHITVAGFDKFGIQIVDESFQGTDLFINQAGFPQTAGHASISSAVPIAMVSIESSPDQAMAVDNLSFTPAPGVAIDIKPGNDTNPINPASRGVVPVAILASDTFDVADVDVTTLAFGPNGAPLAHREGPHAVDANHDGVTDLLAHFLTEEAGIAVGDEEACVTGELLDGTPFEGCDTIATEPPCGMGYEAALLLPPLLWARRRLRR